MSKRDDFEVIDLNDASSEGGKKISGPKARRKSNSKIEVEKVDIKKLKIESDYVFALSIQLDSTDNQQEINRLLRQAVTDLELPSVFGGNTIDECMRDPNWILKF